jgi:hypothetical protein
VTRRIEEEQVLDEVRVRELRPAHAPRPSVVDVVVASALAVHLVAAQLAAALSAFVEGFNRELVRAGLAPA